MSERCERTSERRSEWPSTLRVDVTVIRPIVQFALVIALSLRVNLVPLGNDMLERGTTREGRQKTNECRLVICTQSH